MTNAIKTSALIVTAQRWLTKEQCAEIRAQIEQHLPADVGLVLLHGGLSGQVVDSKVVP